MCRRIACGSRIGANGLTTSGPKIREVVGRSFRVRGPGSERLHNGRHGGDSADRSVRRRPDPNQIPRDWAPSRAPTIQPGAIIVKGMVDQALEARGKPPIARSCEVPEFKHACLGGVYGMKGAIRQLAFDGAGGQAIVVCADIAEYARGSSGEPTQGAGAVAMLLEEDPSLVVVDLPGSGSASDYRVMDFRKPMLRFCGQDRSESHQVQDFPGIQRQIFDDLLHRRNPAGAKRHVPEARPGASGLPALAEDCVPASPLSANARNRLGGRLFVRARPGRC